MSENPDNMALWDQVCHTDEQYTREVAYGKRKFTAICAQYQLRTATTLWGPYGAAWGVKDMRWIYLPDVATANECVLEATFVCPVATFEISADMPYSVGNDTRKKLLTDLTTEALSKLGFNADVFEGRFDGNKYIHDGKNGHGTSEPKPSGRPVRRDKAVEDVAEKARRENLRTIDKANVTIGDVRTQDGESRRGPWTRYYTKASDGQYYQTFDHKIGSDMQGLAGAPAEIVYKIESGPKGDSRSVQTITSVEPEPQDLADGGDGNDPTLPF